MNLLHFAFMLTTAFAEDCDELRFLDEPFLQVTSGETVVLILPKRREAVLTTPLGQSTLPFSNETNEVEHLLEAASRGAAKVFGRYSTELGSDFSITGGYLGKEDFILFDIHGPLGRAARTRAAIELIWLVRDRFPFLFLKNALAYREILLPTKERVIKKFAGR